MKFLSNIYIYTFFILLFILFTLTLKIVFDYFFPVREGMADIGRTITRALSKPFNSIKKAGQKAVGGIEKVFKMVGQIFKNLGKIGKFLGEVFVSIGSYLECSVFYVSNIFSYCIIYYFIYIAGLFIYAPFSFLFWITGTQYIENTIWDILSTINEFIVDITGFNILKYIFPNKCYKCKIKPLPKLKL